MSPRLEAFESVLLDNRLRHGNHPLLNFAASSALSVKDPAGNRKLEKSKVNSRIDTLIAGVMAVYAVTDGLTEAPGFNAAAMIG
jgi:phage terminase large subunit-like protein